MRSVGIPTTKGSAELQQLQETALNHVKSAGLLGDGFGSTPEMCKKNLFWVVTKMKVIVDHYQTWGDVVQVDTCVAPNGKNGMRHDWVLRDCKTGQILTRSSSAVPTNAGTRAPNVTGLGGLGLPGLDHPSNMPDMSQLMQNPVISQMMLSLLSNPQYASDIIIGTQNNMGLDILVGLELAAWLFQMCLMTILNSPSLKGGPSGDLLSEGDTSVTVGNGLVSQAEEEEMEVLLGTPLR
ncbi:hypothetical protein L1987_56792 [Smallanthus sonchifolius]|uniref:Uncharacterized protein n=1 Tax=Smallanthus sonchifolius TaxID=185202 RepID=A0ACB9DBP9_9ASTR|nr:hypothetical protein L1987_56792 [Smallanthus sonchifolius]